MSKGIYERINKKRGKYYRPSLTTDILLDLFKIELNLYKGSSLLDDRMYRFLEHVCNVWTLDWNDPRVTTNISPSISLHPDSIAQVVGPPYKTPSELDEKYTHVVAIGYENVFNKTVATITPFGSRTYVGKNRPNQVPSLFGTTYLVCDKKNLKYYLKHCYLI